MLAVIGDGAMRPAWHLKRHLITVVDIDKDVIGDTQ